MTLTSLLEKFKAVSTAPTVNTKDVFEAGDPLAQHIPTASPADHAAMIAVFAEIMREAHPFVAMVSAQLAVLSYENGADADPFLDDLVTALSHALEFAEPYLDAAEAANADPDDDDFYHDQLDAMTLEAATWMASKDYLSITLFMLCRHRDARLRAARQAGLIAQLLRVAQWNDDAFWLVKLLSILEDEELVVIHPEQRKGYRVKVRGIADNFQLHILLADALVGDAAQGWLTGEKPPAQVAALFKDQDGDENITAGGVFNLVNYPALKPDFTVAVSMTETDHWIWGEGVPSDIHALDGTRVILLTPPPYQRLVNAVRAFGMIPGELEVVETLAEPDVTNWLQRIAAANASNATP